MCTVCGASRNACSVVCSHCKAVACLRCSMHAAQPGIALLATGSAWRRLPWPAKDTHYGHVWESPCGFVLAACALCAGAGPWAWSAACQAVPTAGRPTHYCTLCSCHITRVGEQASVAVCQVGCPGVGYLPFVCCLWCSGECVCTRHRTHHGCRPPQRICCGCV
jgi:hypothetical protein